MKIRIKGNSVRYRLTKTDIADLGNNGFLKEETNFASKTLVYVLQSSSTNILSTDYVDDTITVFMPTSMVEALVKTDKVGFGENNGTIQLLIEKDFTCLENVEEDQSDNYPNPLAVK